VTGRRSAPFITAHSAPLRRTGWLPPHQKEHGKPGKESREGSTSRQWPRNTRSRRDEPAKERHGEEKGPRPASVSMLRCLSGLASAHARHQWTVPTAATTAIQAAERPIDLSEGDGRWGGGSSVTVGNRTVRRDCVSGSSICPSASSVTGYPSHLGKKGHGTSDKPGG
jgi:hypothetical protein